MTGTIGQKFCDNIKYVFKKRYFNQYSKNICIPVEGCEKTVWKPSSKT